MHPNAAHAACHRVGQLCFLATLAGCSDLTKISAPDITSPSSLHNAAGALVLRAGAIQVFANSYSTQTVSSGLIADELSALSSIGQAEDQRRPQQQSSLYPFLALSTARNSTLATIPVLEQYNPTPSWRIAELFSYSAYVAILFAEDMCNGVPLAQVTPDRVSPGPGYSRTQLLQAALADLDSAGRYAVGSDSIGALVHVARARVFLDMDRLVAARSQAESVTVSFLYQPAYDGVNQQNLMSSDFAIQYVTVSNQEGINGLPYVASHDPRIAATGVGTLGNGNPVYAPAKYGTNLAAPITLASGIEARLIVAEALLPANGASGTAWLDTLNALRTNGTQSGGTYNAGEGGVAGLPPLADPGVPAAQVGVLFQERAYWLFGTGQRQGDMRRLIRYYGFAPESVFPTGPYQGGATQYGAATNFDVSGEQSNPRYKGCTDHAP